MRIRSKLLLIFVIFALFIILFFSVLVFENQIDLISDLLYYRTKDLAHEISLLIREYLVKNTFLHEDEPHFVRIAELLNVYSKNYIIFSEDGKILYSTIIGREITEELRSNAITAITNADLMGQGYHMQIDRTSYILSLYYPFNPDGVNQSTVILIELPLKELQDYKTSLMKIYIILIIGLLALLIHLGFIVHHLVIKPILLLNKANHDFGSGNYETRLAIKKKDELGELAQGFNHMADSIKDKINMLDTKNNIMQLELEMAGRVQKGIYPQIEGGSFFKLCIHHQPLEKVSGDYHDVIRFDDKKYGVLVADVSGHGVPAALITMAIKELFILNAHRYSDPKDLLLFFNNELNDLMIRYESYFTAFYVIITPNFVLFSNAQHVQAFLLQKSSELVLNLDTNGYLIGVDQKANQFFESGTMPLAKGDKLILFSDGIIEAMNQVDECYGRERLKDVLIENFDSSYEELAKNVLKEKKSFGDGREAIDDETFIVIEIV